VRRGVPDEELLLALDGHLAGKPPRLVAIDLRGATTVEGDWHPDGALRALVRRRIDKSVELMELGYRDLVTGR